MGDKISNLPDELLLHILSSKSLQTKDVAATTTLSKRWKPLWLSIPKFHFHDKRFGPYESFLQSVDSSLNLVHLKYLTMFSLKCHSIEDYYDVTLAKFETWVNTLVTTNVQYINIWFPVGFYILIRVPIPSSIFKCSSLRILKLARVKVGNLSDDVNLPKVKTLHLTNVEFPNPESLGLLLSKCVALEELLLLYVELPDEFENATLDIGKLFHLNTAMVPVNLLSMEALSNVTFLNLNRV